MSPTVVRIRAVRPDDLGALRAFVEGWSKTTRYQRLFTCRQLTEPELARLVHPQGVMNVGLVLTSPASSVIGMAESVLVERDTSEMGLAIGDAWQSFGLGADLASALIEEARRVGTKTLLATCLAENSRMRSLARKLGFVAQPHRGDPRLVSLALKLQ